jgi:putative redox protein
VGESRLVWLEKERFVGFDGAGHPVVVSSETPENAVGAKPSDLPLIALASCTAVDIVRILGKQRQVLTGLEISARGEQELDPPWRFNAFHLAFRVRGRSLKPEAVRKAVELAEGMYCPVSASLRP